MARRGEAERALAAPGVLLGVGFGAFVDGIVLHQILQWHHLLSADRPVDTVAGLKVNTLADGIFHAAAWVVTLAGVVLLWRAAHRYGRLGPPVLLVGWGLIGFGAFNVVEGVVDHLVLQVHHVRGGAHATAWDLGFLALSLAIVLVGAVLVRTRARIPVPEGAQWR